MKVFAATAVLALAASAHSASAASCMADVSGLTEKLAAIVPDALACQTASGFNIIPPSALPTAEQTTAICSKCTKLISSAKTVTFPDCTFPIGGKDVTIEDLFNSIVGKCGSDSAASNATESANATTTAPAATSAAPAATTVAPAATTAAPMETSESSKAGSSMEDKEVGSGASASTVTTSAPATKAPASAGVSATLGAAVAVACSIAALVL